MRGAKVNFFGATVLAEGLQEEELGKGIAPNQSAGQAPV